MHIKLYSSNRSPDVITFVDQEDYLPFMRDEEVARISVKKNVYVSRYQ